MLAVMATLNQSLLQEGALAGNQDMRAANSTYSGFLTLFKWGTIASVITGFIVLIIIAS
jgi:Bacterial aa3 type cytochrome c oxidase subunit IV